MTSSGRPSPSVPMTMARRCSCFNIGSEREMESLLSAIAAVLNPNRFNKEKPSSLFSLLSNREVLWLRKTLNHVHGTRNTDPMDTRTARRLKGSQLLGVSNTPSIPNAAAERKIAPIFVVSTTPSMTTTRRAFRHTFYGQLTRTAHGTENSSGKGIAGQLSQQVPFAGIDG